MFHHRLKEWHRFIALLKVMAIWQQLMLTKMTMYFNAYLSDHLSGLCMGWICIHYQSDSSSRVLPSSDGKIFIQDLCWYVYC